MSRGLQLLLLSCACSLAPAAREMVVACSEDVVLPCTAPWDPRVSYTISWAKVSATMPAGWSLPEKVQNGSVETPGENPYSLKIQNTTSCNTGTYKCTLWEIEGQRNQSGTVNLRVTGCPKERKEETFKKYRAEIVLLFALVVFYLTLIIFTCKFAQLQSIFPDFSKPMTERAFLPVTYKKHLGPVTLHKTQLV
ncbi:CD83 antigen isoform X2 [Choloepus didactylus]|uniref:CD83 antigen isoform X2 n=1 Tax=Choloepus didactylus TaxID=27675 RepID=UPI0018A01F02|nr:CD83 antigen isoform X2 [Choloepus didactylus]